MTTDQIKALALFAAAPNGIHAQLLVSASVRRSLVKLGLVARGADYYDRITDAGRAAAEGAL